MSSMSAAILLFFLLCLADANSNGCPTIPFTCGGTTLSVGYPFFTDTMPSNCRKFHYIQCNTVSPVVQFNQQGSFYVVEYLSLSNRTMVVHDYNLSTYPWQTGCFFLYQFNPPLLHINLTNSSLLVRSSLSSFNCTSLVQDKSLFGSIDGHHLSCMDYNLLFSLDNGHSSDLPAHCSTAGGLWFSWELSFGGNRDPGGISVLSAGYSRNWDLHLDCFSCNISGSNCSASRVSGESACSCAQSCGNEGSHKSKKRIAIIASLASIFSACLLLFLGYFLYSRSHDLLSRSKTMQSVEACLNKYGSLAPKRYKYSEVKRMTKSFSHKIGEGGYGAVFKGSFPNGHLVAVKVLREWRGDGEEFINEVISISRTSHVNIVGLLGFCLERTKRALIYDFMPNGSLERYIFTEKSDVSILGWEKLYDIALGIARGLEYLHQGCNTRIVHFDIKPHNILLDEDYCPKISDFGLAKLCPLKKSTVSLTAARGTAGYIAPEVFYRRFGVVSSKSDVYSYGMMVLEMVGGRKKVDPALENSSEIYFSQWIYDHLRQQNSLDAYGVSIENDGLAKKMMLVALWCIQTNPGDRPTMNEVVEMLQGRCTEISMPPCPYTSNSKLAK